MTNSMAIFGQQPGNGTQARYSNTVIFNQDKLELVFFVFGA